MVCFLEEAFGYSEDSVGVEMKGSTDMNEN